MAIIEVRDEAHWHELRSRHVGGSDVAAVLGASPYKSKWQLHMEKAGKLPAEDLSDNAAVLAGTYFEAGIARWASDKWGMGLEKVALYHTVDAVPGMGASLDYIAPDGAPVEIKWSARGHGWRYSNDEIIEAPEQYILQVQHQIDCVGAEHGWLIALIDNEPRRMLMPRHDGIITTIRDSIAQFWDDVRAGIEPDPDFSLDGEAIARLIEQAPYAEVDVTAVPEAEVLFREYKDYKQTEKLAAEKAEETRAKILKIAQEAMAGSNGNTEKAKITCGEHKMSIYKVAANPGKEVTEDMVGSFVGARKGYQGIRIT